MEICESKQAIEDRQLLTVENADELVEIFEILANNNRLRILHVLIRNKELGVMKIAEILDLKPQAISNQLRRMADRGILSSRKEGSQVFYTITDPCIVTLLDRGICLTEDSKERIRDSEMALKDSK